MSAIILACTGPIAGHFLLYTGRISPLLGNSPSTGGKFTCNAGKLCHSIGKLPLKWALGAHFKVITGIFTINGANFPSEGKFALL